MRTECKHCCRVAETQHASGKRLCVLCPWMPRDGIGRGMKWLSGLMTMRTQEWYVHCSVPLCPLPFPRMGAWPGCLLPACIQLPK